MHTQDGETLTLAPAAGAGLGKILFDRLLADPEIPELLVDAVRCGLKAMTQRRWDPQAKEWVADADAKTRVQTVVMLLAQAEGEPVKRIIHQHLGAGGQLDVLGALRESPALLAAAEREIEKAKWRASGRNGKAKKAEPVPAETVPGVQ